MINDVIIDLDLFEIIAPETAFENNVLPLNLRDNVLQIAVPDNNNIKLINDLRFSTGLTIETTEFSSEVILIKLKELFPEFTSKSSANISNSSGDTLDNISNVEFVNQIISNAVKSRASDIHFEVLENNFRIRYRIDGHLREIYNSSKARSGAIASRVKIMASLDIAEKRRPQDGRIKFTHGNNNIDIRVSVLPASYGEKIVLRLLDKTQSILDIEKLGLEPGELNILKRNIHAPHGLVLVTGPTGSGKTTTLYAAIQHIHSIEKNILTVEDPIEYNLEGINQCNVKPEIGFDFANALRSFLRQDPDVIMLGEIRDKETSEIAIRASLTGHLVFSTLHTNDSISAVSRLVDIGVEPYLVSSSLRLIIAQRLVRNLCDCKKLTDSEPPEGLPRIANAYEKSGCEKCHYTGYRGRSAIFELLEIDNEMSEAITKNSTYKEIREIAVKKGFTTLRDNGIQKIINGNTSYEEVLRETML